MGDNRRVITHFLLLLKAKFNKKITILLRGQNGQKNRIGNGFFMSNTEGVFNF